MEDFAEIAGMEMIVIDGRTTLSELKKELRWNEASYR
jgi:L-arabinose isomerase